MDLENSRATLRSVVLNYVDKSLAFSRECKPLLAHRMLEEVRALCLATLRPSLDAQFAGTSGDDGRDIDARFLNNVRPMKETYLRNLFSDEYELWNTIEANEEIKYLPPPPFT